jgi:hypothetical protein
MESAWRSFTQNGHTYTFDDGPYHANKLARDWIEHEIENSYLLASNREFDSLNYGRAFADALIALWGALDNTDPLKKKAKMTADVLLIDGIMDIGNANSTGGVMGRADYSLMGRNPIFPAYLYWGSPKEEFRHDLQALWAIQYEPPAPIIDLGVLTDEDDSYFHFHKEFNNNPLLHRENRGKWTFASKYYNIGSSDGHKNQGWCAVVKGDRNKFIRFWINGDAVEPPDDKEGAYLGNRGRQFKNAMFVDLGSQPYYWEKGDANWDTEAAESGWLFKKLGKVMVALRLASTTASVELATEGVEYKDWTDFRNAVKNNGELTSGYFITSKRERINSDDYCGLNRPGDCAFPFKRIETIDQNGNKIVQWKNKVMTISHKGRSLVYDFNNWVYSSSDAPHDIKPPAPPKDVSAKEPQ